MAFERTPPPKTATDRKDEYDGKYKPEHEKVSEEEAFGGSQNPVTETPVPYKNLKEGGR